MRRHSSAPSLAGTVVTHSAASVGRELQKLGAVVFVMSAHCCCGRKQSITFLSHTRTFLVVLVSVFVARHSSLLAVNSWGTVTLRERLMVPYARNEAHTRSLQVNGAIAEKKKYLYDG